MRTLPGVEIDPAGPPLGVVLWLHGLGASGHDFEGIVPLLELPQVRFVFPHAPPRPVTINAGMVMPAWYDVLQLAGDERGVEDESGIRASAGLIEALLEREEQRGVPSGRIVLAGFSQGGAMALHVGTRYPRPLGGIMVLSGYEVLSGAREAEQAPANLTTPLLACHGRLDPLVPLSRGRRAFEAHAQGRPAEWREFPIGHEVSLEEIAAIRAWLHRRLAPAGAP
jgi:phospholipase/carboxylesterase